MVTSSSSTPETNSAIIAVFTKGKQEGWLNWLVASTFSVKDATNLIDLEKIQKNLCRLKMDKVLIVNVTNEVMKATSAVYNNFEYAEIDYNDFFTHKSLNYFFLS